MNVLSSRKPASAIGRYRACGLFGGATLGSVIGVLVSGPNFFVWSPAQSVGVIAGMAAGLAAIGYFFVGLVVGGFTGGVGSAEGQGETSGSVGGAGDGADGGGGGD